jgi:hypothetical protein
MDLETDLIFIGSGSDEHWIRSGSALNLDLISTGAGSDVHWIRICTRMTRGFESAFGIRIRIQKEKKS